MLKDRAASGVDIFDYPMGLEIVVRKKKITLTDAEARDMTRRLNGYYARSQNGR